MSFYFSPFLDSLVKENMKWDLFIESSIQRGEIKAEEVYNLVKKHNKLNFSEILPKLNDG